MYFQENRKNLLHQLKAQLSGEFDDATPFLLFPVRLETRFMEVQYPSDSPGSWTLNGGVGTTLTDINNARLSINGFLSNGPLDESARTAAETTFTPLLDTVTASLGSLSRVVPSEKFKLETDTDLLLGKANQFVEEALTHSTSIADGITKLNESDTVSSTVSTTIDQAVAALEGRIGEASLPADAYFVVKEHIERFNGQMQLFAEEGEVTLDERRRVIADYIINGEKIAEELGKVTAISEEDYGYLTTIASDLANHLISVRETFATVLNDSQTLVNALNSVASLIQARATGTQAALDGLQGILQDAEGGDVPDGVAPGFISDSQPNSPVTIAQELWVRVYPDEVMVDSHEEDLTQGEINAGEDYWTAIWDEESNEPELIAQWNKLADILGPQRAAWVRKQTTPTNLIDRPGTPPAFPSLTASTNSWGGAAHSDVMPDRFVVVAYDDYGTKLEWLGRPITTDPLPAGFDPSKPNAFNWDANGDLDIDPAIKWMVDFQEAYNIGMGIRVPLEKGEETKGFKRLFVLGLRMSAGAGNHETAGKQALEQLFDNHHYSNDGLSFLPQGTPTNNTEESRAGYRVPDPGNELSYAAECKDPLFQIETDLCDKTDGQWMAEALGIDHTVFEHVRYADNFDVRDAIAMNQALWPATIGFYLEHLFADLFMETDMSKIRKLRDFFTSYVSARGFMPTFRIRNQPYGILATTAYSKWQNSSSLSGSEKAWHDDYESYVKELESYFWDKFLQNNQIRHVHWERDALFPPSQQLEDSQANFLNVMGLNPNSIEFFQRHGISQGSSGHILTLMAVVDPQVAPFMANSSNYGLMTLFYYLKDSYPYLQTNNNLIESVFLDEHVELNGPLIDINPISELRKLRETDGKNYIQHLLDGSVVRIRGNSFANDIGDNALLFLFLRQALLQQYRDSSSDLLDDLLSLDSNPQHPGGAIFLLSDNPATGQYNWVSMTMDSAKASDFSVGGFINIQDSAQAGNNGTFSIQRVNSLERGISVDYINANAVAEGSTAAVGAFTADFGYGTAARKDKNARARFDYSAHGVTEGSEVISPWNLMLKQVQGYDDFPSVSMEPVVYLRHYLDTVSHYTAKNYLREVRKAMEILECLTTAQLERAFVEHLDLAAYRIDGWKQGLINKRLREQRTANANGIFLGAFAWVEDLRPAPLQDVPSNKIPEGYANDPSLHYDTKNQGYIHAPSLPHATAAAMLRSGYAAHAQNLTNEENIMAVNLSSARVRKALSYIEGIRHGQGMDALLGYQFERGLHDSQLELDQYILDIRKVYPLTADSAEIAQFGISVESIEANQVVDGHALLENARDPINDYPYGVSGLPDPPTTSEEQDAKDAIIAEVAKMRDAIDAVADLAVADSVYAAAQGNYDRAAAMMDSVTQGKIPPVPEVQNSHRTGRNLTNRVAMMFTAVETQSTGKPRKQAEPSLNGWLENMLGDLANYKVRVYEAGQSTPLTSGYDLTDFGLEAIDLLYLLPDELVNDAKTLTKLIGYYVRRDQNLADDVELEIRFMERDSGWTLTEKTLMEMIPLLSEIKNLVTSCRALHQEDFLMSPTSLSSTIATNPKEYNLTQLRSRVDAALGQESGGIAISGLKLVRKNLFDAHATLLAQTIYTVAVFDAVRSALIQAVEYGVPNVVPGSASGTSDEIKATLLANASHAISEIDQRIEKVEELLTEVDVTTPPEEVLSILQKVDRLQNAAKTLFGSGFYIIPLFTLTNTADVNLAIGESDAILPDPLVDPFPMDDWLHGMAKVRERMKYFESFSVMADNFDMPLGTSAWEVHLNPVQLPHNPLDSNGNHNTTNNYWMALEFPDSYDVDENILSLAISYYGSKKTAPTALTGTYQCGLLVDEWTEMIPNREETTGIAFHYDKPEAKPAQSLLLCVTPEETGQWKWDDLLDTLHDTLDNAKKRAVEPDHFSSDNEYQNTGLDTLLPALVADLSVSNTTLPLDLAENNDNPMYDLQFTDNNGLIANHEAARDANGQIIS